MVLPLVATQLLMVASAQGVAHSTTLDVEHAGLVQILVHRHDLAASQSPALGGWAGSAMKATHYWDCSGQGCDATTLAPWDLAKYVSPPGYGPQDPDDFGGAKYGEKMWLTGAASDALSELMGDDDGCCGHMDNDSGGCGKCLLIQNPASTNPDWTAVVMKKNRCPPESTGCGSNKPHFDIAAPGFDNLQWSTANICGQQGTGFASQSQSDAVGSWWTECSNTADCAHLCNNLPQEFRKGCQLFASWGWTRGDPDNVKYKAVECPAAFTAHVGSLFGENGPTPGPSPSQCPSAGEDCRSTQCCEDPALHCFEKDEYWASCRESCTPGVNVDDPPEYQSPWSCTRLR